MEFQTLRKSHKKEIIIGAIAVCVIGGALTFSLTRAKYEIANDLELAKGTINYKAYDFKIMAMYKSDDKTNYTEIEEMPSEGYTINEDKSYCNMSNGSKDTTAILKTIGGNHIISKLKKNDKCFIYFDKKTPENIPELIASLNVKDETPDFSKTAVTDEGIFITDDPMYGTNAKTYYWRGAATTNHVIFANKCWRIVRVNGDKTMRLIYNGTIQSGSMCTGNGSNSGSIAVTNQAYNLNYDRSEYVGWTYSTGSQRTTSGSASNIKNQTETWYSSNITGANANKVADGKFCNDRNMASGYSWSSQPSSYFDYAARGRLESAKTPTFSCPVGDVYELKAGAITADEVSYAGGVFGSGNASYYLYNGQYYWTMSPYNANNIPRANVFLVSLGGQLNNNYSVSGANGVRPVINLKSDITFSGGDGTQSDPYVVQ